MLGFFNKSSKNEPSNEADAVELGRQIFKEWREEINQECSAQLLFVKNFVDENWEAGEQTDDLLSVISSYCGAIDGTDMTARKIFKRYEDRAAELQLDALIDYTQKRKLQHLLQLRTFFEYKLKVSLAPVGAEREKIREMTAEIVELEFSQSL
jgi:hypothetical protein